MSLNTEPDTEQEVECNHNGGSDDSGVDWGCIKSRPSSIPRKLFSLFKDTTRKLIPKPDPASNLNFNYIIPQNQIKVHQRVLGSKILYPVRYAPWWGYPRFYSRHTQPSKGVEEVSLTKEIWTTSTEDGNSTAGDKTGSFMATEFQVTFLLVISVDWRWGVVLFWGDIVNSCMVVRFGNERVRR